MRELTDYKKGKIHSSSLSLAKKRTKPRILLLAGILLLGIFFGSMWQQSSLQNAYLSYFAQQYLAHCGSGLLAVVSGTFLSYILLETVVLFFSFSCIGTPVLFCIAALYGIPLGCITTYLYTSLGMRGLLANMILFLVPHLIAACSLVYFLDVAIGASTALFRIHMKGCASGMNAKMRYCFNSFLITLCGMLAAALLKGILCAIFAPVLLK